MKDTTEKELREAEEHLRKHGCEGIIPKHFIDAMLTFRSKGQEEKWISVKGDLLAEQHRNTRHDAIDKIEEIYSDWQADPDNFDVGNCINKIISAIMNLKQRSPIPAEIS